MALTGEIRQAPRAAERRYPSLPWSWLRRAATPVLIIALWQYATEAGWVDPSVLAPPSQVWATFLELSGTGEILIHVLTSLQRVLLGLAIGGTVAVVLGLASGLSRLGDGNVVVTSATAFRNEPYQ